MGDAIWLFLWCLKRQTTELKGIGYVYYGQPITYERIHKETKHSIRSIRRWMSKLLLEGYIRLERKRAGNRIMILNAKKFKRNYGEQRLAKSGHPEWPNVDTHIAKSGHSQRIQVQENQQFDLDALSITSLNLHGTKMRPRADALADSIFPDHFKNHKPKTEAEWQAEKARQQRELREKFGDLIH